MKKLFKLLFTRQTCTAGFNISQPHNLTAADPDKDGLTLFDLTLNNDVVLEGLDITEYIVSYFPTEKMAHANKNPFTAPWKYINSIPKKEFVFVRVSSRVNLEEYTIASFSLTAIADFSRINTYDMVF